MVWLLASDWLKYNHLYLPDIRSEPFFSKSECSYFWVADLFKWNNSDSSTSCWPFTIKLQNLPVSFCAGVILMSLPHQVFLFVFRWTRGSSEEDLHQMGQLSPVQGLLQDHRSLRGPEGRTDAHQTAGGPVRRETGTWLYKTARIDQKLSGEKINK